MTTKTPEKRFEDRLLNRIVEVVANNAPPNAAPANAVRRKMQRLMAAAAPVALAATAFALVSLLSGPRPGIALATVIARSSAALSQPNTVMHIEAVNYGGNVALGEEAPIRDIGLELTPPNGTGLSPNPANDPISFTYKEWMSADGRQHTIYSTGDETASSGQRRWSYDPANNTLTITDIASRPPSATPTVALPDVPSLTTSEIESLYRQALAHEENDVQLIGQTTIAGQSVYELNIAAQASSLHLYIDAQTFLPVRAVLISSRPAGPRVVYVTSYVATSLPGTPANETLLQMSAHPSATQVQLTEAQLEAARSATTPQAATNASDTARAAQRSRAAKR